MPTRGTGAASASILNGPFKCSGPPLASAKVGAVIVNPANAKRTTKRPTVSLRRNGGQDSTILILGYCDKYTFQETETADPRQPFRRQPFLSRQRRFSSSPVGVRRVKSRERPPTPQPNDGRRELPDSNMGSDPKHQGSTRPLVRRTAYKLQGHE